jgi:hypothetical protein
VQFLRLDGDALDAPIRDEKQLSGTLLQVLRQLDELLELNVTSAVDLTSGRREERSADYPLVALQQIARNAVMHRSYEHTNAPIRVTWYVDRIEVVSPGGPYGVGVTDYRTPRSPTSCAGWATSSASASVSRRRGRLSSATATRRWISRSPIRTWPRRSGGDRERARHHVLQQQGRGR